jgi:Raf kinase inhibitor-like YbhB/YbcL family protein
MSLNVGGVRNGSSAGEPIVFCKPVPEGHVAFGENSSPSLSWSAPPKGTRSLAILMYDDDVPADATGVNKEGMEIPDADPRRRFYHWTLANLPATLRGLSSGAGGSGVTPHGRAAVDGPGQAGVNDYTSFFAGEATMAGTYRGYDGPCPPWNDERIHSYVIRVFALDVSRLVLPKDFTGAQFEKALEGHVLSFGASTFTYSTRQSPAG